MYSLLTSAFYPTVFLLAAVGQESRYNRALSLSLFFFLIFGREEKNIPQDNIL